MKSSISTLVAITFGAAGLLAASAWAPARAGTGRAKHAAKAAAARAAAPAPVAAAKTDDHCGLDDLGYDQLLAKRTEPVAPRKDGPIVDTIAQAKAAAAAFELGPRTMVERRPTVGGEDEVEMKPHTLTPAIVAPIVEDRLGDLYYCFMRIPRAERTDETFLLHLTIAPKGVVLDATVGGGKHAARIQACVKAQARRWVFPQGDAPSEVDYPLSFNVEH